jgi:hypothetical protein
MAFGRAEGRDAPYGGGVTGRPPPSSYQPWWHRLPIGLIISALFFGGAYRTATTDNNLDGVVMITVAVLMVGIWITTELHDKFHQDVHHYYHRSEEPGEDAGNLR